MIHILKELQFLCEGNTTGQKLQKEEGHLGGCGFLQDLIQVPWKRGSSLFLQLIPTWHALCATCSSPPVKILSEKATYHRGRSLWSQTGGPISSPRNCGPQSCYLLFLRQVLKGPCWRPPQQPIPPVLRISEVWYREQGWRAGKAGTIATTPASCCCMCGWVDICSPEAGWDLSQKFAL